MPRPSRTPERALPTRILEPEGSRRYLSEDENVRGTALMARYRDTRDPEAFEELYTLARGSILLWIKSLLGRELSHLDPNELLQDTFVNVYRYPASFREEHAGSFRVWVRTIAGNVLRRAASQRARSAPQDLSEACELEDRRLSPVQAIGEDEETERLRRTWMLFLCLYAQAWAELAPRDRSTLQLVEVEGLSYQEAGERLAVGRSNMKMIVFRSRKRIARRMRAALSQALQGGVRAEGPALVA